MLIELAILGGGATLWRRVRVRARRRLPRALAKPNQRIMARAGGAPERKPAFSVTRLARDIKSAMGSEGRQGLQIDLDPDERARMQQFQQQAGRRMAISVGAMGLAALGGAYPLFSLLGIGAVLYLARDLVALIRKDFQRGHYLSSYLLGAVMLVGMIASGHLLLAAVGGFIGGLFSKVINRLEDDSEQALVGVFGGHPEKVWVLSNGVERAVDFHTIESGDRVVVNAGEVIPVDGRIEEGQGQIDQHLLTGESQPVEKGPGEPVFASTLLLAGRLCIHVDTAGKETVAAKIGQVLDQTQGYKETLILRGRQVADRFIPLSVGLAVVAYPLLGPGAALTTLWANFGGGMTALGPLSVLNYLQVLSRRGILIKDGRIFESLHRIDTVVFDKTGTLTLDQPTLERIHAVGGHTRTEVLRAAAAAEHRQPHPIARAILAAAEAQGLELAETDDASYRVGYGIDVRAGGERIRVGSARFMRDEGIDSSAEVRAIEQQAEVDSHTLIHVAIGDRLAGVLEMRPTLRPEAKAVVAFLKARGIDMIIISGDHAAPTRRMAQELGIERHFAETLPEHKADKVKQLREEGRFVCFIGDGINDAIALKSAQVSISLKGASSAATDTAQVIFMDGTLAHLESLFGYADQFEQTMKGNLVASFAPAGIIIGGVVFAHLGIAGAMAINVVSGFAGIGNTLRPLISDQQKVDDRESKTGEKP